LGFGVWAQTPNPQSPIPNPQSPIKIFYFIYKYIKYIKLYKINFIENKIIYFFT